MSLSDSGTNVYYNGVWLRNVLTKQFDQTVEYDSTGTDRIYTKFIISVESIVSDDELHQLAGCTGASFVSGNVAANVANFSNAQYKMQMLQSLLSVPRQRFEFWQGQNMFFAATSQLGAASSSQSYTGPKWFNNETDLDNGPKPRSVSISQVIANRCYRISFSIECCVLLCLLNDGSTDFANFSPQAMNRRLLSNRFSIEEVRDGNFFNTRMIIGRARVAHIGLWDMGLRYLVMPILPNGYKRESVHFTHADNGLDMLYRVTDRQRYAAPPWPAVDFQGTHTEATGIDGVHSEGSVSVRMIGSPGTSKQWLLAACVVVAETKIGKIGPAGQEGETAPHVLVNHLQISDVLQDNVIELNIQFQRHGDYVPEPTSRSGEHNEPEPQGFVAKMASKLGVLPGVFVLRSGGDQSVRLDGRPANSDPWPVNQDPWGYEAFPPWGRFCTSLQDGCIPDHATATLGYRGPAYTETPSGQDTEERHDYRNSLGDEPPPPPPPKEGEKQPSEEHQNAPYTFIEVRTDYFNDYGFVALPFIKSTSGNDEPEDNDVLITRLHAPVCRKNLFMTAKRVGAQPKFPKLDYRYTDANGITFVLDEFHPEFLAPRMMADKINMEYQINARIVYLMSRALKQGDDLTAGTLPWDNQTKVDNKVSINTDQQDEEMA